MNKTFFILLLIIFFFPLRGYCQHPAKLRYDFNKKKYSISAGERKAIKSHIREWLKQHDTIIAKSSISSIAFTADDLMLAECDSIAESISYHKTAFKGFPIDNGIFFGADIMIKNKEGGYDKYTINLSYSYVVLKIWNPVEVFYLRKY